MDDLCLVPAADVLVASCHDAAIHVPDRAGHPARFRGGRKATVEAGHARCRQAKRLESIQAVQIRGHLERSFASRAWAKARRLPSAAHRQIMYLYERSWLCRDPVCGLGGRCRLSQYSCWTAARHATVPVKLANRTEPFGIDDGLWLPHPERPPLPATTSARQRY